MSDDVEELYDYDALRHTSEPTVFIVDVARPTLVLGSQQPIDLLTPVGHSTVALRRRRGGGGLVLLHPRDLWVDWWIPPDDPRWSYDVRESSIRAGAWWRDALAQSNVGSPEVYLGPVAAVNGYDVACFAGRGPGEVFLDQRKVVGISQWRVREGVLISSVLPGQSSDLVPGLLAEPPQGLAEALHHHTLSTLAIGDPGAVVERLTSAGGFWRIRRLVLAA